MKQFYVLFENQINGIKLNKILKGENINAVIAPTPRELSTSCGISLLISEKDVENVERVIETNDIRTLGIATIER